MFLCLLEYLLTPATILCHAMLENAKAFSVHETGFKHKIYRWLCFAKMRDLVSGTDQIYNGGTPMSLYLSQLGMVCCGKDQERIQDRAFSIRHWK